MKYGFLTCSLGHKCLNIWSMYCAVSLSRQKLFQMEDCLKCKMLGSWRLHEQFLLCVIYSYVYCRYKICDYSNTAIFVVVVPHLKWHHSQERWTAYVVIFYYKSMKEILDTEHSIDIYFVCLQ
jgi:hypothetical protein